MYDLCFAVPTDLYLFASMLLAQGRGIDLGSLSITTWIKIIIVIAGAIAVLYVILRQLGVQIPPFIVTIFWIVVAVFVGIIAINILISLL